MPTVYVGNERVNLYRGESLETAVAIADARETGRNMMDRERALRSINYGHFFNPYNRRCVCGISDIQYHDEFFDHETTRVCCVAVHQRRPCDEHTLPVPGLRHTAE